MKAKIPPDIVFLSCGILMWLITKHIPGFHLNIPYPGVLAVIVFLLGFTIIYSAKKALKKQHTTERPGRDALYQVKALVTNGVYRHSRNPIYLGMVVLLFGWALILTNWLSMMGVIAFVWFITLFQILPEENALAQIFGDEYRQYKRRVRRWI